MVRYLLFITMVILMLSSCEIIKRSSKFEFSEGYYKSRVFHKKLKSVYIIPEDDSIKVYSTKSLEKVPVDTVHSFKIVFPSTEKPAQFSEYWFKQNSFDLDIISISLKYRPRTEGFPNQLNSSILNGALFIGYRTDLYHLKYKETPLGSYKRDILHYGLSIGVFTGIGATTINEFVTSNQVNLEYDGFINPSGMAAIIALDKVSFVLSFGVDHLLDKYRKLWIYQGKPWIGFGVGLDLN